MPMALLPPPHAGHDGVGHRAALVFGQLHLHLLADHALEVAHHRRVGVRPHHAAQDVEGVAHVGHPVADGLVGGVFQGAGAARHGPDLGPQQPHAEHVQGLAAHVLLAHVDHALQAQQRRRRGRGDAVLARARLGDDLFLAHAHGQQRLSQTVVDLVRAREVLVLALEVDLRAARVLGQARGEVQPAGTAHEILVQLRETLQKGRVLLGLQVRLVQFVERGNQRFGHVAATVAAVAPAPVRLRERGNGQGHTYRVKARAKRVLGKCRHLV